MLNFFSLFVLSSVFHFQAESINDTEWVIGTPFGKAPVQVGIFFDRPAPALPGSSIERFYLQSSYFQVGAEKVPLVCARVLASEISNDHLITSVYAYPDLSACEDEEKFKRSSYPHLISYRMSSERPGEMLGLEIRYLHNSFRAVPN